MNHLELREKFKEFFKSKKHAIEKSSSLIPIDDPSLLFTTAGMLQFKPYYAGIREWRQYKNVSDYPIWKISAKRQGIILFLKCSAISVL